MHCACVSKPKPWKQIKSVNTNYYDRSQSSKRNKTSVHPRLNILIQPVYTGVHPQCASQTKTNSHFLRFWASPWCSCLSVPFFINSTEYLELSIPKSSCCCFRISSMSLELFLLKTPVKQDTWDVLRPLHTTVSERNSSMKVRN